MAAAQADTQRRTAPLQGLGARAVLLAVASVGLMALDHREGHLDALRGSISALLHPLRVVVTLPAEALGWVQESTVSRAELERENDRLKTERLLTNARLQRFIALEAENARLRAMLDATPRLGDRVRVAEIMSVDANPYRHYIVIDKGSQAGAYAGQAIVDASGVIGQVVNAGPFSAEAMLISDPDHALPVEVNRNGLRTIAVGTGELDRLALPFLPNNADVRVGDLLVTSGLGGAFPAGYPVAVVTEVTRKPEAPFASLVARPVAALERVREVLLVWPGEAPRPGDSEQSGEAAEVDTAAGERADTDS